MFGTCGTKFTQLLCEFCTASDEHARPGNEATPAWYAQWLCTFYSQTLYLRLMQYSLFAGWVFFAMNIFKTTAEWMSLFDLKRSAPKMLVLFLSPQYVSHTTHQVLYHQCGRGQWLPSKVSALIVTSLTVSSTEGQGEYFSCPTQAFLPRWNLLCMVKLYIWSKLCWIVALTHSNGPLVCHFLLGTCVLDYYGI